MSKHRIYSKQIPSELIRALISENNTKSGDVVDCEACHRTHLSKNWRSVLEDREIEAIEESLKERPEKYCFADDSDPIYFSEFDGKSIVLECPCNFLSSIEERWTRQRRMIEEFFRQSDIREKKKILKAISRTARMHIVPKGS